MKNGGRDLETGDFPPSPVAAALPLSCNVPMEVLYENVKKSIARAIDLVRPVKPHYHIGLIIGGGPSAEDHLSEIGERKMCGQHVFALNGAGLWLRKNAIDPHAIIVLDARTHNARFVAGFSPETEMLIASQCDETVFDAASRSRVIMWHVPLGDDPGSLETRPAIYIGGGTSTGIRALRLLHVLGYREIHLYGYDSSYRDGDAHAFDQFENAGDAVREVICGGRAFVSTPWMIRQADDFQRIAHGLAQEGMEIHVHGDGLLPEVARQMPKSLRLEELKAEFRCPEGGENELNRIHGLLELIEMVRPSSVLEIGSSRGVSTEAFLLTCDHVTAIDPWEAGTYREFVQRCGRYPNLAIVRSRSPFAVHGLNKTFDLAYIDGAHDYASVKADIEACRPIARYLSGHDYYHPPVRWAVDECGEARVFSDGSWLIESQEGPRVVPS